MKGTELLFILLILFFMYQVPFLQPFLKWLIGLWLLGLILIKFPEIKQDITDIKGGK